MKAHTKPWGHTIPRRHFIGVAIFVISSLLLHSFDGCADHLAGSFERSIPPTASSQAAAACLDKTEAHCNVCTPAPAPDSDGCGLLSEVAVLKSSSQFQIESHYVVLPATVAVIPAILQLITLSGSLYGFAKPPPARLTSAFLRSSLASRAPPYSA